MATHHSFQFNGIIFNIIDFPFPSMHKTNNIITGLHVEKQQWYEFILTSTSIGYYRPILIMTKYFELITIVSLILRYTFDTWTYSIAQTDKKSFLKRTLYSEKIWIHLMQNIFRNQTVKNLIILDNPFKRYDFSKFSLNSVKSLCRPHKLATVPCHGCTTPHWFCTQIITNFQFSWIWVKLLIKLIPKSIQIHIYPKQTWLISRGNLLFTWELYF